MKERKDIYRVMRSNYYSLFMKNGLKHNLNGPALTIGSADGDVTKYYYVNGEEFTYDQWTKYVDLYTSYTGDPQEDQYKYNQALASTTGIYVDVDVCKSETISL